MRKLLQLIMKNNIEDIETMSYEECYEKIDKHLLSKQLTVIFEKSLFYKEKFKQIGLNRYHPSVINNFSCLPFTNKNELLAEQQNYPPFGRSSICGDTHKLRRVHVTSGSTGCPLYIILTENDIIETVEAGRRAFICAGLTPQDIVIHCLNYCLWAGGLTDHLSLEATGATVIPFGVGNSKNLIKTIIDLRPTAISGTPSYLSRLEYILKTEFDMSPSDLGLQKAFFGGEGGLQNPEVRKRIEDKWNIKAIDANYGMADVLSIFGSECDARQGLHFHGQGIIYLELIDLKTGKKLPVIEDQVGEMVLTNLLREAQPLVRYKTGDVIRVVSTSTCSCGRNSLRFLVVGRADDMITVRGINVYPNGVANILSQKPDWFSGEFEFVLDSPPPFERPLLHIELAIHIDIQASSRLEAYLIDKCHEQLSFTPRVEFIAFGEFPRTQGKTKRVRKCYNEKV